METVEKIVLSDLNRIIASIRDLKELAEKGGEADKAGRPRAGRGGRRRLKAAFWNG